VVVDRHALIRFEVHDLGNRFRHVVLSHGGSLNDDRLADLSNVRRLDRFDLHDVSDCYVGDCRRLGLSNRNDGSPVNPEDHGRLVANQIDACRYAALNSGLNEVFACGIVQSLNWLATILQIAS